MDRKKRTDKKESCGASLTGVLRSFLYIRAKMQIIANDHIRRENVSLFAD